jgi:hypothetical protein
MATQSGTQDFEPASVDRVLEILRSARHRKSMYLDSIELGAAVNFLNGFKVACFACGLEVPLKIQKQVTIERGWKWNALGAIKEMQEAGLSEEQVVDELFAIEISGWEKCIA